MRGLARAPGFRAVALCGFDRVIAAFARPLLLVPLAPLSAHAGAPSLTFQYDPVEYYAARFMAVSLVVGIGIVLYSLVRYRGQTPGTVSWMLLVAGVLGIPSLSFFAGMPLVFERAERVEFCAGCHLTMGRYVADMKNPASDSLAAVHFKNRYIASNQCYVCHTSYGMFGTVEAKLAGLNHLYKYQTGTFHLPIKMRNPYPNNDCLKCHAEAAKWETVHADFKPAVFQGTTRCLECHAAMNPAHMLSD